MFIHNLGFSEFSSAWKKPAAQCPQSCMFWTAKFLQNLVLISMGVKPSSAVGPNPTDLFPPHDSGLSQLAALLFPQTLPVLQIGSGGSPWYLQSAPRVSQDKHKERSFILLPTRAPSIFKQDHPTCTSGASQCHLSQVTGSSWSCPQPRGTSPAGEQTAKGKLIKTSSDLKGPGTTNVTLNFSQLGHQDKAQNPSGDYCLMAWQRQLSDHSPAPSRKEQHLCQYKQEHDKQRQTKTNSILPL